MVKKWCVLLVLALCLSGCGQIRVYETVSDLYIQPEAVPRSVSLTLPEEAAAPVSVNASGDQLYVCDGYTITVQTLPGGDLEQTLRTVTGYGRAGLTIISQQQEGLKRYDMAWSSTGEGGDQVGRTAVLDDGIYHYVLSVMAPSENSGELEAVWQSLFRSFRAD